MPTGMEPTARCQSSDAILFQLRVGPQDMPKPCAMICTQSRKKNSSTATSVPTCNAISNVKPGSVQPNSHGISARWPLLLIGQKFGDALDQRQDDHLIEIGMMAEWLG